MGAAVTCNATYCRSPSRQEHILWGRDNLPQGMAKSENHFANTFCPRHISSIPVKKSAVSPC